MKMKDIQGATLKGVNSIVYVKVIVIVGFNFHFTEYQRQNNNPYFKGIVP